MRRYRRGQLIVIEGQESRTFVILARGIVGIYKDGQRVAVISEPGTYLGEMSSLLQDRRTATMRAENDVEAYVMPSQAFDEILESAPRVGMKIMQSLASRLRSTTSDNALQQRQITRLREGGGAPDSRTSTAEDQGAAYAERAMGELVFLIRTAMEFDDSPVLTTLLRHALRADLVPANVHHVPDRAAILDVLAAAQGPEGGARGSQAAHRTGEAQRGDSPDDARRESAGGRLRSSERRGAGPGPRSPRGVGAGGQSAVRTSRKPRAAWGSSGSSELRAAGRQLPQP